MDSGWASKKLDPAGDDAWSAGESFPFDLEEGKLLESKGRQKKIGKGKHLSEGKRSHIRNEKSKKETPNRAQKNEETPSQVKKESAKEEATKKEVVEVKNFKATQKLQGHRSRETKAEKNARTRRGEKIDEMLPVKFRSQVFDFDMD